MVDYLDRCGGIGTVPRPSDGAGAGVARSRVPSRARLGAGTGLRFSCVIGFTLTTG